MDFLFFQKIPKNLFSRIFFPLSYLELDFLRTAYLFCSIPLPVANLVLTFSQVSLLLLDFSCMPLHLCFPSFLLLTKVNAHQIFV